MGMTVKRAIEQVKGYRNRQKYEDDYAWSYPFLSSIDTLLKVADKYQKIEQIVTEYVNNDFVGMSDYWIARVKEVIEDGNDD